MRSAARTPALGLILAALASLGAEPAWQRFTYEQPQMGTRFRIVLYAADRPSADQAAQPAYERFAELNGIMSDYLKTSELMRLCAKSGPSSEAVPVSEELFTVLTQARTISELSHGAFDVTVGPLVSLWRHARRTQKLPTEDELRAARARVGWRHMILDPAKRTVRLTLDQMQLDLGGIAKGYAADEGLRILRKHGITRALVAAGGDIAVGDAPPEKDGWTIDIEPLTKQSPKRTLLLQNAAVSTSGDSQQFVEIDGVRYSHVLDPRTGLGLTGRRSVTVVAPRGLDSDPWSKVASVLPVSDVETKLEIFRIEDETGETMTPKFRSRLVGFKP